jgi:hypothetical protein
MSMPSFPSPEQLQEIIHTAGGLVQALWEAGKVDGLIPPFSGGNIHVEAQWLCWFTSFERALNPLRKRDMEWGTVVGWPNAMRLGLLLDVLNGFRKWLLTSWDVEALMESKSCGFNRMAEWAERLSKPRLITGPHYAPGHVRYDVPHNWPCPVPLARWQEANYVVGELISYWTTWEQSVQSPPAPSGATFTPALDKDDLKILKHLAGTSRLCTTKDIAAAVWLSDKTIGKRLAALREVGLVHRPRGSRGGNRITSTGLELASRFPKTTD